VLIPLYGGSTLRSTSLERFPLDLSLTISVYVFTSLSLKLARLVRLIDTSSHSSHRVYTAYTRRDPKCHSNECERSIDRRQSLKRASLRIALFSLLLSRSEASIRVSKSRRGGEPANQLRRSDVSCSARIASSVSFSAVARIATAID